MKEEQSMDEIADTEIVEPFVMLGTHGDEGAISLDQDTARSLYALAWTEFKRSLANANALYNEHPTEQPYQFNRAKRLLWEADRLKQAAEVICYMTAAPRGR